MSDPPRYVTFPSHDPVLCTLCGTLVGDVEAHDRWHEEDINHTHPIRDRSESRPKGEGP